MAKGLNYNGDSKKEKWYKIKKYSKVVSRTINQSSELKRLRTFDNDTLNKVLDAFLMAKKESYTNKDAHIFNRIEQYRANLLQDSTLISYEIFGSNEKRTVAQISSISPSSQSWAKFLYCLTKKLKPLHFLEIGTNVGISGSYILEAMKQNEIGHFVTMEGVPQLCSLSNRQFLTIINNNSFEIVGGLYQDTMPVVVNKNIPFDLLFIDGNHQKAPTVEYFQLFKKRIPNTAVFIFDDIYYSEEMTAAWNIVKADKAVSYSIDLQKQGILIVDTTDSNRNIESQLHLAI